MKVVSELRQIIQAKWPELDSVSLERVLDFYQRMLLENEVQNLTRLTSPEAFYDGHLLDVRELLLSNLVEFPAMDLGSGAGVPGLLSALIRPDSWILAESEKSKAAFLTKTSEEIGIPSVRTFPLRGEQVLSKVSVGSIVSRAVGPVSRIYSWIRDCSTWNNLILFKGPKWEEEWKEFKRSNVRDELSLKQSHSYTNLDGSKQRVIVKLTRVPRRT